MKQKVTLLLIMTFLTAPLTVSAAGQKTQTVDETKARVAEAQSKRKEVVVKLRPGTKILVGYHAVPLEFVKAASLSGRVKEIREKDFTFSGKSSSTGEVIAVISYDDLLSIKRPSGFAKVLKNIGKYSLLGAQVPLFLPVYGLLALFGELPSC